MNKRNIVTVMGLMLCVAAPASASGLLFAPQIERIAPVVKKARPVHRATLPELHRIGRPITLVRRPDLMIRTAVIRPAQACRSGAPVLYVTARIQNIGRGPSVAKASVGMVQARNMGGVNWGNGHGLPALAPGAITSVTFPIYYLQSNPGYMRGTHTFKLTVNAGRWVRESNYANNGFKPVKVTLPRDFCGGAKSRAQPGTQLRLSGHRGMISTGPRLYPPRLRVIRISSKIDKCPSPEPKKFVTPKNIAIVNATIYNDGGPLARDQDTYVNVREFGGARLISHAIPVPPLAHGQQVVVKIPVDLVRRRFIRELPGTHKLTMFLQWSARDGSKHRKTSYAMKITFPPDYCQPKTGSVTHGKMPDLIPQVSNPFNGIIKVKNQGNATAGASKLTVNCKKIGGGPGGDCPSTPALDALPSDASGALFESVPALHAGQVYTISLPVQGLKWGKGPYLFTYKADATHAVAESNESNNKLVMNMGNALSKTGSFTHGKMPDLIPQVSNPFNGIIKVRNIGGATAGASKLTVNCEKIGSGFVASTGDCPSTPALDALHSDASGALLESVPALHAGQVYMISLPVQGLKWNKGKYRFTYKADATHAVAESNESNNVKTMVRQR